MKGRYQEAPLVYVECVFTPHKPIDLNDDSESDVLQAIGFLGFCESAESLQYEFQFSHEFDLKAANVKSQSSAGEVFKRYGFFNNERTLAVILSKNGLVIRTTEYEQHESFFKFCKAVMTWVFDAIRVDNPVVLWKEVSLAYCDVVVPREGRSVEDYFSRKHVIQPLNSFLEGVDSIHEKSRLTWTKIIEPILKIEGAIEVLPQKVGRILDESLIENEKKFAMPVRMHQALDLQSEKPYVVMTNRASMLLIGERPPAEQLWELHPYIDKVFQELLNQEVCDKDWKRIKGDNQND